MMTMMPMPHPQKKFPGYPNIPSLGTMWPRSEKACAASKAKKAKTTVKKKCRAMLMFRQVVYRGL